MSSKSVQIRRRGFTLIELLTVIAIIGILAAILIPTVGKVRDNARKAKCVANVRQITAMLINWANQDKLQRFPNMIPSGGGGPWDVLRQRTATTPGNVLTLDDLAKNAGPAVMYCPSAVAPEREPYTAYAYAAIDYLLLVGESGKGPNLIIENPAVPNTYHSDRIRSEYRTISPAGGVITVGPSQRELVVDALGAKGGTSWNATTDNLKKAFTNHLDGAVGAGANIGFVDGHVAWRSKSDMQRISGSTTPVARFADFQGVRFTW